MLLPPGCWAVTLYIWPNPPKKGCQPPRSAARQLYTLFACWEVTPAVSALQVQNTSPCIHPKLGKARVCASAGSNKQGDNLSPTHPCSAPPPTRHSLPSLWLFTGINKSLSVSSASPQDRLGTFSKAFMWCKDFSTSCCNPAVSFQLCTTPTSFENFALFHFLKCHLHNLLGYRFSSHHTTIQSQGLSIQSLKSASAHLDRFLGAFTPDPVLCAQSRLCTTCKC